MKNGKIMVVGCWVRSTVTMFAIDVFPMNSAFNNNFGKNLTLTNFFSACSNETNHTTNKFYCVFGKNNDLKLKPHIFVDLRQSHSLFLFRCRPPSGVVAVCCCCLGRSRRCDCYCRCLLLVTRCLSSFAIFGAHFNWMCARAYITSDMCDSKWNACDWSFFFVRSFVRRLQC